MKTQTEVVRYFQLAPIFRQRPSTREIVDALNFSMVLTEHHDFTPTVYALHALVELHGVQLKDALVQVVASGTTLRPVPPSDALDDLGATALTAFGLEFNTMPGTYSAFAEHGHVIQEILVGEEVVGYIYRMEVEEFPYVFCVRDLPPKPDRPVSLVYAHGDSRAQEAVVKRLSRDAAASPHGYSSVTFANMDSLNVFVLHLVYAEGGRLVADFDDASNMCVNVETTGGVYGMSPGFSLYVWFNPTK